MSRSGFILIWRSGRSTEAPTAEELRAGTAHRSALQARQVARRLAPRRRAFVPYVVGPKGGLEPVALGSTR